MGAEDVSFKLDGRPTWSQIEKAFRAKQEDARAYYGHQEGYTGSWGDVDDPQDKRNMVFGSRNEASEWCSRNVEKRDCVVVTYKAVVAPKDTKAMAKLSARIVADGQALRDLKNQPVKLAKFVTCEGCHSKVSSAHLKGTRCPVCGEGDFRPLGLQRKITKLDLRIKATAVKLEALRKAAFEKAQSKCDTYNTLVYGVAPC